MPCVPSLVAAEHDPEDVEFSILKQRLARRLLVEGHNDKSVEGLDLVELTKVRLAADAAPHMVCFTCKRTTNFPLDERRP